MSANPEAVNFGTGPSEKLSHWEKFKIVMNPYKDTFTMKKTIIAVISEYLLTLLFVFYCAASVVAANYVQNTQNLLIGCTQGFALALCIYIAAPASGGHLNPAVTISVLCVGRINFLRAMLYIVAQFAGAITGAALMKAIVRHRFEGNLGSTVVNPDISVGGAWGLECVMTFLLVFVMFSTAIDPRGVGKLAPLAIGLVVLIDNLIGAHWTGASMNPARTLGPQLVSNTWDHYWLYFFAPVVGALCAAVTYVLYLKIDPVNEAVDQNNNIIRKREAVHNIEKAPPKYQPEFYKKKIQKKNLFRRSLEKAERAIQRTLSDSHITQTSSNAAVAEVAEGPTPVDKLNVGKQKPYVDPPLHIQQKLNPNSVPNQGVPPK